MDFLSCLKSYLAVVRNNSFSEASRQIYKSTPTISKQVKWLEEKLDAKLLVRTTRHVAPTEAGQKLYDHGLQLLETIKSLESTVVNEDEEPHGRISLASPQLVKEDLILNSTIKFMKKNPRMHFDIYTHILPHQYGDTDLVITFKKLQLPDYDESTLSSSKKCVVATPDYLEKYGTPKHPRDLANHNCLIFSHARNHYEWYFKNDIKVNVHGNLHSDNIEMLAQAASYGIGILLASEHAVASELNSGTLVKVLEDFTTKSTPLYVYKNKNNTTKTLQLFIDFLSEQFCTCNKYLK